MNYAILHLKKELGGLTIHKWPDGPPSDEIEPTVWMQWVGTPKVATGLVTWMEVTYSRPRGLRQRGWVAEHLVDIIKDKMFKENMTVHERQVEYVKSVSFPKPPDIPHIERDWMPETDPIMPRRGYWLVVGLSLLVACIALAKIYLHTI